MRKIILYIIAPISLVFWLLALWTYSIDDYAWSNTGNGAETIHNWGGVVGAWLADISHWIFGYSVWWCVLFACYFLFKSIQNIIKTKSNLAITAVQKCIYTVAFIGLVCISTALEWSRFQRFDINLPATPGAGGILGNFTGWLGQLIFGFNGLGLLGVVLLIFCLTTLLDIYWLKWAEIIGTKIENLYSLIKTKIDAYLDSRKGKVIAQTRETELKEQQIITEKKHPVPFIIEPSFEKIKPSQRFYEEKQPMLFTNVGENDLPRFDLLDPTPQQTEETDVEYLNMTSRLIENKLSEFNVDVRVISANPGPVITRYEIEPATGVKGSQIVNLGKDLARSLSKVSLRVVETIPGKNLMALELPNVKRQIIHLSEILESEEFHKAKSKLTVALGKDIVGKPIVADLAKMPHVLVAGTTGSGKSVGINAMILSLLYKSTPSEVRLLMIDPKMLEMAIYADIPHLLAPVVTDMSQAANGLNWCVNEMERRYKLMSHFGVRNLAGFNSKIIEAKQNNQPITNPFTLTPEAPEPIEQLPQIVIVVDEFADLIMVIGKKIEELIARIAQKARAAGIHLILATQRPSVDVITGLIKANIPSRIAFQVSSKIDSRTILDQMGAENLLGMGDMLYMPSGTSNPTRVHGAFVSDAEVQRVVDFIKAQAQPNYIEGVLEPSTGFNDQTNGVDGDKNNGEKDALYDQAVEIVLKNNKASISLVQRHLGIGYNRSANLLDAMEKSGIVSSMSSSGKREILVPNNNE